MTGSGLVAKPFTLEEANRALPLVRSIVRDIVGLSKTIEERKRRLEEIRRTRPAVTSKLYDDEMQQIDELIETDIERLQTYADELSDLGIELKSISEGLVDFPTMMEGVPAYLCWKYDEPKVSFWHHLDAGFAGRKPIS